jgi:DNA-binding beta-propeller fold protein YncE
LRFRALVRFAAVAALLASAAGCGGGSSGVSGARAIPPVPSAPPGTVTPQSTEVTFSVTFPARAQASAARRHRAYVSPSIASLSIVIDGAAPIYVNAPAPPATTPQTITTTVPAPPGTDTFAIEEFDKVNGAGNELGEVSMMSAVIEGQDNIIDLTVNGELAKIAIEAVPSPFLEGTLAAGYTLVGYQPETFMAVPEDADDNTIVAPGNIPGITVSSATPASIVESSTAATNTFTLQAPAPTAFVAITASGTNLEGATVKTSFNVDALAAFYVADYTVQEIRAFDENGTPLTLPATAFPALTNPVGLAFVPGGNGSIVVTETSNYAQPLVADYDLNGNAIALSSGAFSGLDQPLFAGYGAGRLYVPNYENSTFSIFDTSGNGIATATGSFSGLTLPAAALYDPDNGDIYITNLGNNTIESFTATGTLIATATTGSKPMAIAYDSVAKNLYVAFAGTLGGALNAPSVEAPTPGGIDEFTPALAAVTNTGGFVVASTESYFTGMAFDPYTKYVYAADAGMSKIDAYSEAGAAETLATGAFGTISASNSPPSEPQAILFVP